MAFLPAALRVAQVGLQGLRGGGNLLTQTYAAKGPAGLLGQKAFEYIVAAPLIGAGARALGLPVGLGGAPPAAPPPGGMSQQQMDFMKFAVKTPVPCAWG